MAENSQLGISLRLIRAYDPESDKWPRNDIQDRALNLAMVDKRDLPFASKLQDAMQFLTERAAGSPHNS